MTTPPIMPDDVRDRMCQDDFDLARAVAAGGRHGGMTVEQSKRELAKRIASAREQIRKERGDDEDSVVPIANEEE